jgi:hypothetical protein
MKVRRNARKGTATLTIAVPWSAELRLRGRGIKRDQAGAKANPSRRSPHAPTEDLTGER